MVVEVACPSPIGVMFRGTGLLLGAISIIYNNNSKMYILQNYGGLSCLPEKIALAS